MKKISVYAFLLCAALTANAQFITQQQGPLPIKQGQAITYDACLQTIADWKASARPATSGLVVDYYKTDSIRSYFWSQPEMAWTWSSLTSNTYDCDLERRTSQLFQSGSPLVNRSYNLYTYYPDGALYEDISSTWYEPNSEWLPSRYIKFTANENVLELSYLYYFVDNQPSGGYRLLSEYLNDSAVQTSYFYVYDVATADWVLNGSTINTFDAQGRQLESLRSDLVGGVFVENDKWIYSYDAAGNIAGYLHQVNDGTQWVDNDRIVNTHDANNNPISTLSEAYVQGQWIPFHLTSRSFDASGNQLTLLEQNYVAGNWVNEYLQTITYYPNTSTRKTFAYDEWASQVSDWHFMEYDSFDVDGNQWIKIDKRYFDPATGVYEQGKRYLSTWDNGLQVTWTEDNLVPFTEDEWRPIYRSSCGVDAGNLINECILEQYDSLAADYVNAINDIYFNSECASLGTESTVPGSQAICQLPNPYHKGQSIECPNISAGATVSVFSPAGKLAYMQQVSSGSFSIENELAPGMYFLVVSQGGRVVYRTKLVMI